MTAPTVSLTPVAVVEPNVADEHSDGTGFTVWFEFPNVGVDRPRTYGISVRTRRDADRLVRATEAGVVLYDIEVKTDVHGQTYVGCTSRVSGRYLNADLKRLGF